MINFSKVWLNTIATNQFKGNLVRPRGKLTREMLNHTIEVDMRHPVLMITERKLSYTFMLAEAYWILSGDNRVKSIDSYNKNIAQFSDDGETFFGAYGPKISQQLPYVVNKLISDNDTRQAGLTIWRESPGETKDVPCTIAIFFQLRGDKLHCSTFMRSSDIWLGLPYDVFNFSMLTHVVCSLFNENSYTPHHVSPGTLYLTAASSHLYEEHFEAASNITMGKFTEFDSEPTPELFYTGLDCLMSELKKLKDEPPSTTRGWWHKHYF